MPEAGVEVSLIVQRLADLPRMPPLFGVLAEGDATLALIEPNFLDGSGTGLEVPSFRVGLALEELLPGCAVAVLVPAPPPLTPAEPLRR